MVGAGGSWQRSLMGEPNCGLKGGLPGGRGVHWERRKIYEQMKWERTEESKGHSPKCRQAQAVLALAAC